jgi:adenylate cyclase
VVASLLESPGGLQLGGESRLCTIMMADLRGFTALSERLTASKVVALLNNFLEAMTEVIFAHGGTIDEFLGDAILVVFGAPVSRGDDAQRAVACAVAMQLAMPTVNAKNLADGLPPVEMGIGLHTGEVVAGNIGSKKRAKYGVVGAAVNMTSRIESYTVGGQILVSEETRAACQTGAPLRIDGRLEIEPKGVARAITVYDVGGIGGSYALELPRRDRGLVELAAAVPVRFTVLDGKREGGAPHDGAITRISPGEVEVEAAERVRPLTDLKLELAGDPAAPELPFYGKVLAPTGERVGFCLRFTSLPVEVERYLRGRLATQRSPA